MEGLKVVVTEEALKKFRRWGRKGGKKASKLGTSGRPKGSRNKEKTDANPRSS
jgi:hypothetical protein